MRPAIRAAWVTALSLLAMAGADTASAQPPAPPPPSGHGLLVLSAKTASEAAWPLAKELYARASLRPTALDEGQARVLAGETPAPPAAAPATQATSLKELADTRDAIHGDDAPSRQLLLSLSRRFHTLGVVVVSGGGVSMPDAAAQGDAGAAILPVADPVVARVFVAANEGFDAARYVPDPAIEGGAPVWTNTVISLERAYGAAPPKAEGPGVLTVSVDGTKPAGDKRHPFYASPWFWGALAAAAFTGAAIFFATQDSGADTIHLQMQVPR